MRIGTLRMALLQIEGCRFIAFGTASLIFAMPAFAAQAAMPHSIRFVYFAPSDKVLQDDFANGIANAALSLQTWYPDQVDGFTVALNNPIVERCQASQPESYFTTSSYSRVFEAVQLCFPQMIYNDPSFRWVIYADVRHVCNAPERLGAGGSGITIMPVQDLEGLAAQPVIVNDCGDSNTFVGPSGVHRWIGGLGHELGHALGLPHPPGCEQGLATCDVNALMWAGYANFPDTYLRSDEKAVLLSGHFFFPAVNYEGLWWNAPAGSESGWGMNLAHQSDVIFATWFTYDATGKPWWLSMTASRTAPGVFTGTLYQTRGPAFNAVPFNPLAIVATAVGSGSLTFNDGNDATFSYSVNGISQTKSITREVFGALPTCRFGVPTDPSRAANHQDLWWAAPAGTESGWGVNLTQQGDVIFVTWFTYDVDGNPLWLSATAYLTTEGVYSGALYRTTGPAFDAAPFETSRILATAVGTLTLTFADGGTADFAYTIDGIAGAKSITREVFRAPGTACQ